MSERFSVTTRNGVTSMKRSAPFSPRVRQAESSSSGQSDRRATVSKISRSQNGNSAPRRAS